MKKLLFVLALGAFAACGSGESKEPAADTTVIEAPAVVDTMPAPIVDTTAPAADTTVK